MPVIDGLFGEPEPQGSRVVSGLFPEEPTSPPDSRFTPDQLAAEEERKRTGKRKQFDASESEDFSLAPDSEDRRIWSDIIGGMVGTTGRAEIASDESMGPLARAIESPVNVLTGMGETPMSEAAREVEAAGGDPTIPGGYIDPRLTEKLTGGLLRTTLTGGLAGPLAVGATEAAVKAADIAQNEPGAITSRPIGSAARVATAGIVPGAASKVASMAVPAAAAYASSKLGQAALGTAAGVATDLIGTEFQKGVEYLGTEDDPTLSGLGQALKPTTSDIAMALPGVVASALQATSAANPGKQLKVPDNINEGQVIQPQHGLRTREGQGQEATAEAIVPKAQHVESNLSADDWQKKIDQMEESIIESQFGGKFTTFFDPSNKDPDIKLLENEPGWAPMPPGLKQLYDLRDSTGAKELTSGIGDMESHFNKLGVDPDTSDMLLNELGIDKYKTSAMDQYIATSLSKRANNPEELSKILYMKLANKRGIPMDDTDDLWKDSKTTHDAVKAAHAAFSFFNRENVKPVRPTGLEGEAIRSAAESPATGEAISPIPDTPSGAVPMTNKQLRDLSKAVEGPALPPTTQPTEGPVPRRSGSINTQKFTGDQQEQMALYEAVEQNRETIDKQRGTTRDDFNEGVSAFPQKNLEERAAKYEWDDAKVERLKPNEVLNDEEMKSLRNFAKGVFGEYEANKTPDNSRRRDLYLKAISGVSSATGRALAAHNVEAEAWLNSLTPKDRAFVNMSKFYGPGKEIPADIKNALDSAKTDAELNAAIQRAVTKQAGAGGQINGIRYFNMLSSPMTQGLNTTSGLASTLSDVYEKAATKLGDVVLPGKSEMAPMELRKSLSGMAAGTAEGARKFLYILQHGYSKEAAKSMDPSMFRPQIIGGGYNPMNWPSRLLDATDNFFGSIAETGELSGMAWRKAYNELTKDGGKPTDADVSSRASKIMESDLELRKAAKEYGMWRTHREQMPEHMESMAKASRKTLGDIEVKTKDGNVRLGDKDKFLNYIPNPLGIAIPFIRVPYNVTKKLAFNYSPGAVLNPKLRHGTRTEKIQLASQMAIGTATMAAIAPWVMSGNVTGAVPKDPAEREAFYEARKKPYSIKIGDRWYDYKSLGGLASPFIMASALWDSYKEKEEQPDKNMSVAVLKRLGSYAVDSTYLAGMNGIMSLLSGDSKSKDEGTIAMLLSQFVPASSLQRFINNTTAEGMPDTDGIGDRIIAGTVFQETLPRRKNQLGKDVRRGGYFPSEKDANPVYAELHRLGLGVPQAERTFDNKDTGKRESFTPEEYRKILSEGGLESEAELSNLIKTEEYQAMSDEEKAEELQREFKFLKKNRARTREDIKEARSQVKYPAGTF